MIKKLQKGRKKRDVPQTAQESIPFMSCIENLNVYYDVDVALKVAKAVTDTYVENWTDSTCLIQSKMMF